MNGPVYPGNVIDPPDSPGGFLFGEVVNVQVVEQGFSSGSDDNEIDDLIESLRPAANGILAKLNMEQILHARLDP